MAADERRKTQISNNSWQDREVAYWNLDLRSICTANNHIRAGL
jgi:hypothetical protein